MATIKLTKHYKKLRLRNGSGNELKIWKHKNVGLQMCINDGTDFTIPYRGEDEIINFLKQNK